MRTDTSHVYWELGKLGVSYELVAVLMSDAIRSTKGWNPGHADIPGTDRRLKYDSGTDGMDGWFVIEDKT